MWRWDCSPWLCLEHRSPFEFQGKVHVGQCPSPFVVLSFVPFGAALCQRRMHQGAVPTFLIQQMYVFCVSLWPRSLGVLSTIPARV